MGTTVTDPLVGRLVDGRYEVMSRIARGGMATVYLAIDRRLDREVALKVMHPHLADSAGTTDFVARFRREARAAARLTHPGLVGVYDQGLDGDTSYLTMEYIDGANLRHHLGEQGALTVDGALTILDRVLDALAVAHRAGLVHRDIKPENVLIATDERVKLADFGLARAVTEVTSATTGTVFGTVAYLAPELVSRGVSDARTDVYAAGILLYEMLTGRQPFTGETPIQVAFQHVNTDIPAPSDAVDWLPVEIDELVGALAARDPQDRPVDASAALALVRRTRASLDTVTLARRADVAPTIVLPAATDAGDGPSGGLGPDGHDADGDHSPGTAMTELEADLARALAPRSITSSSATTTRLDLPSSGGTVALPIGVGMRAADDAPPPPRAHRRRRVIWAAVVTLLIAAIAGGAWWFQTHGPGAYTTVPPVVGQTQERAEEILAGQGLLSTSDTAFDDAAIGTVIAADPGEGGRILKEGTVALTVSKGLDLVAVPADLVTMMQADAEKALIAAGLTATYAEGDHWHDTATIGSVLAASAEPGTQLERDSSVELTISDGPEPVTIISVVGATEADATEELTAKGLVVATAPAFSDTVDAGSVISQDPAAATEGHRGDTVTLTISQGPELIPVPDMTGKQFNEAKQALEALGFAVKRENVLGGLFGTVRAQSVEAGESVRRGTEITLTVV